ncbi:unnamed protein product [Psylliodes chrysocephalus]|uniref:C2H2-type domain-containing protein n=1 Tax=Psylliodes chrysocephalus TaxID=3402493 RepID=A0A9P0CWI0_9CUCU|nr:unnamed protein product [Psylliodes chrysocephala]
MNLKQEPSDSYVGVVKTESGVVSEQTEENDWCSIKQEPFKNDHYILGFGDTDDNNSEYKVTEYLVNVGKFKEEIDERVVPKIEYQLQDFPEKIECDSIQFVSDTIKKEIDVYDVVDISETKQEVSDSEYKQFKTETELLTTYCDLPTLKSESTEYLDNFVQPCSSKYEGNTLKTLKTTTNVIFKKKKKLYRCLICQKSFSSSLLRSTHIDGHFEKCYAVCQICGKFMKKIDFFQHFHIHAVNNRIKNHIDDKPSKYNFSYRELIKRKRVKQKYNLQKHCGKKLFKCKLCSAGFTNECTLLKHLLIHEKNAKPFECDICCKRFSDKSVCQRHSLIHRDDKPFKCDMCSKGFNDRSALQKHLIIHSDEKPFKCYVCSRGFKQMSHLRTHLIIHTGDKPFKCDICSKRFSRNSILQVHLIIHTGDKPFKCDICCKRFSHKSAMRRHLIRSSIHDKIRNARKK